MSENKESYSPYVAARHEWDERYGGLVSRSRQWRLTALIALAVALISAGGMVAMSARISHVAPFVAVVDGQGRALASGFAEGTVVADDRLKRASLYAWVGSLRTVTTDGIAQRKAIDAVYAQIANGTEAQQFVSEFYRNDSPFHRAQSEIVSVDVSAVLPTTSRTYEVDWTETTRDLYGTVKTVEHWKGSFEIAVNPPTDEQHARINPIGLYVTNANWSKIL